jgi:hypothetical protein
MAESTDDALLRAAAEALPAEEAELLRVLHAFTAERLAAGRACRARLLEAADGGPELHDFLREAWEVLDGLAREVNLVMHALFPDAGLYPPFEMSRQCTLYVVRKVLHEGAATAGHRVADLLWRETHHDAGPAYRRLSFLHNLSLFLPVKPAAGRLPGAADLPATAQSLIKPEQVGACGLREGLDQMLAWLAGFVQECYARLAETASNHEGHEEHEGRRNPK